MGSIGGYKAHERNTTRRSFIFVFILTMWGAYKMRIEWESYVGCLLFLGDLGSTIYFFEEDSLIFVMPKRGIGIG